ncbi:MAG: gspJ [Akkermansiaceae bacterium]|nr:gspJ [Akkermansiaceae bacterium]
MLSVALASIILLSAYLCLSAGFASQKLVESRAEVIQTARVAMALMSADLRSACPLSKDFEFLGMHRLLDDVEADNIDFATHNYVPRRPREGDFCAVSFFVEKDPESGRCTLWRRRNPAIALDPLAGGSREEIAHGLRGVRFEYYDGYDWYDTWGETEKDRKKAKPSLEAPNLSGMPEAVRITLSFDPSPGATNTASAGKDTAEPPLVFQTVARLNLAAISQRGADGGASPNSPQGTRGPATPATESGGTN